jgi:hypothetical protein
MSGGDALIPLSNTRPASQKPPTTTNTEASMWEIDIPAIQLQTLQEPRICHAKDVLTNQRNVTLGLANEQDAILAS